MSKDEQDDARLNPADKGRADQGLVKKLEQKDAQLASQGARQGEGPADGGAKNIASGPFVPDIARAPDDDFYLDAGDKTAEKSWKIPSLGWFVLGALMICGAAAGLKVIFREVPEEVEQAGEVAVEVNDLEQKQERVRAFLAQRDACARGYLGAGSIEEKLSYARHPQRVKALMENYYKEHDMVAEELDQFEEYRVVPIDGVLFAYGIVVTRKGVKRSILMEQRQDGSFRVDWETDVCYQPVEWDRFIAERPASPLMMRVYVKPDNFYAYEFSDDIEYDCYKLTSLGSDDFVFGYIKKASEHGMILRRFYAQARKLGSEKAEPFTLLLRFPENSRSKRSVHIDRVMAPRWVFVHEHEAQTGE